MLAKGREDQSWLRYRAAVVAASAASFHPEKAMMMMGRRRFSGGSWSVRNWLIGGARPPVVGACLSRRWVATAKAAPQMKLTAPEPLRMITGRAIQAARRTLKEASAHACMAYAG